MSTRIAIIDKARSRIGAGRLQSEAAPGAAGAIQIYDSIVNDILSGYPWSFGKKKRRLMPKGGPVLPHWKYTYERPSDMIGVPRAIYSSGAEDATPITTFEITEAGIHADSAELWALYPISPTPAAWPAFFAELIVLCLAAEYALSVREDSVLRDKLRRDAYGDPNLNGEGGKLAQAKSVDTQSQPSPTVGRGFNPLVDARFGSGRGWGGKTFN